MLIEVEVLTLALLHFEAQYIGEVRVVVPVDRQQANIIRRVNNEPLVSIVKNVLWVVAHPYFRSRLSNRRNEYVPTGLCYCLSLFYPAYVYAFQGFHLRDVVFNPVKHEKAVRRQVADVGLLYFKLVVISLTLYRVGDKLDDGVRDTRLKLTSTKKAVCTSPGYLNE